MAKRVHPATIVLPPILRFSIGELPPSANHIWKVWRGHQTLTPLAREYKAAVGRAALDAAERVGWRHPGRAVSYILVLELYGLTYKRDVDNCPKLLQDGIAEALGFNDAFIDAAVPVRCDPAAAERVDIALLPRVACALSAAAVGLLLQEAA